MKMNVAQALVRYLKERGIRHVFGVSGHSVFEITDAIYQETGIDFTPSQIEVSAGYMANGYARGTGGLSVCLVSSGAGATNVVSGVAQAFKEGFPLLAISSDVDTEYAGKGRSSWHEVPQQAMFEPLTKLSVTLDRAQDILEVLQDASRTALTPPYGPVYVGVPADLQAEEIDVPAQPWGNGQVAPRPPDARLIAQTADVLRAAAAPTIVMGGGVHWARCAAEVIDLAELLGAPIGTSPSYKGLVSEEHPLALGVLGTAAAPFANATCLESDVILAVGTSFSEAMTLGYGHRVIPAGARIIQIDVDATEIGKTYPVEIGIVADAKLALQQLIAQARGRASAAVSPSPRVQRMQRAKAEWRAELADRGAVADGPITAAQLYRALNEAVSGDAVFVTEGTTPDLIRYLVGHTSVYTGGDFRPIGYGFGTTLGLKCAFPDRQVVCVSGDGSFMMEMQELSTAMKSNLPVLMVVIENGGYGNMKRDQIRQYAGRVIGTELHVPDLPALAAAFGAYGARVERSVDLVPAIQAALAANKPALLDVVSPIEGI